MFIDEAGQVALGTTIANATSAKNLVLIGDQMQLSQPLKGTHEGYAKLSSLDFILEDKDTIPPEQGIFLRETRRLNEKICKYISESFYENRLMSDKSTKNQNIINENNYSSEDTILIIRTFLNKAKRLLKIKKKVLSEKNIDNVIILMVKWGFQLLLLHLMDNNLKQNQ